MKLKLNVDRKPKFKIRLKNLHPPVPPNSSKIKIHLKNQFKSNDSHKPFWNQVTQDISHKFWSPSKDNCLTLKSKIPLHSWVTTTIQKQKETFSYDNQLVRPILNLPRPLPLDSNTEASFNSRKIRLFPNKLDRIKLIKLLGAGRYVYNRGIDFLNSKRHTYFFHENEKEICSLIQLLRYYAVHDANYIEENSEWMIHDLPSDTRDLIIKELEINFWNGINSGHNFELKKRSKKNPQSIPIRIRQYNTQRGFYSFIRSMDKAELFPEPKNDLKIHMDELGHFYLVIPYPNDPQHHLKKFEHPKHRQKKHKLKLKKHYRTCGRKHQHDRFLQYRHVEKVITHDLKQSESPVDTPPIVDRDENQIPIHTERILSGDPGVRTFLTCYTPDGYVYHCGVNNIRYLYSLFYYKNKLQGAISQAKGRRRRRMLKAWKRASKRMHNLVNDFHKKLSKWLLENFTLLILPKLDVGQFQTNKTSRTVRNKMRLWRHCSFMTCLKNMSNRYPRCRILNPSEEYTSRTCSRCGSLHPKFQSKTFCCLNANCQQIFDRDVNASLNILLKTLTES